MSNLGTKPGSKSAGTIERQTHRTPIRQIESLRTAPAVTLEKPKTKAKSSKKNKKAK